MFVADKDIEFECARFDEDIREKLPETGRETDGSLDEAIVVTVDTQLDTLTRDRGLSTDSSRVKSRSCLGVAKQ